MKKITLLYFCLFFVPDVFAQSDMGLNHRWFSRLDHNPSSIKQSEVLKLALLTRNQWVGFDGAPVTQVVNAAGFMERINSGVGLTILNDKIGYTRNINAKAIYAYSISLSEMGALSLGVSGGIYKRSFDLEKIKVDDETIDPELIDWGETSTLSDFDFGVEYYDQSFEVGASITHLNPSKYLSRNYYAYTSAFLDLGGPIISPGILFTNRSNISYIEFNTMFYARMLDKNLFWLGASYKLSAEEGALFCGIHLSESMQVGYSFDFNFTKVNTQPQTSHEIMLMFRIKTQRDTPCSAYDRVMLNRQRR